MKGSHEAFWWSLFSAGGVIAAMLIPVLVFVTVVAPGFGCGDFVDAMQYDPKAGLVGHQLVKAILFVSIWLSFFHAFHRIRHLILDMHVSVPGLPLAVLNYALATAGTVSAALVLWRI